MNKRTLDIIGELGGEDLLTIAGLAERHGVSQRTIRKDLDAIDDALRRNGQAGLRLERGGRIVCMDDPRFLLQEDVSAGAGEYRLTRDERIALAAALIVMADDGTTLGSVAETLLVSRTTIINDLEDIKALIEEGGLKPVSKASKGLKAEGGERQRRLLLVKIAAGLSDAASRVFTVQTSLLSANAEVIRKISDEQQHVHGCVLTDVSARAIEIYLCIAVARLQAGHPLTDEDVADEAPVAESPLMPFARDLMGLIERYFRVHPTDAETALLCERLDHQQYARRAMERDDAPKVQLMTRQLIARISEELGIELGDDFTFFESLSNHLDSVLQPEPVEYPDTPLIREVIRDNEAIVRAVRACDDIVCSYVGRELSELELGYVALHVCAAIERKKRRQSPLHVAVVCNSGVGTSQLLRERLQGNFNFKITRTCTSREARDFGPADADLVISTVPLDGVGIDWMLVSPLLTEEDTRRVSAKVNALRSSRNLDVDVPVEKGPSAQDLLAQLAPVVYDLAPDRAPALMRAIRRVVSSYFGARDTSEAPIGQPTARDLLTPSHIRLDVACADWREAVRESAQVLLKGGYIEPRYVDAMIANIEENGPYVVLTPGFAMPHEGVDAGTNEVGLSLIRLARSVNFGEPDLDPVEFVCCLSPVDHSSHMRALFNLVALMRDESFKRELHNAWTPEQAAAIIERWELGLPQ